MFRDSKYSFKIRFLFIISFRASKTAPKFQQSSTRLGICLFFSFESRKYKLDAKKKEWRGCVSVTVAPNFCRPFYVANIYVVLFFLYFCYRITTVST